MTTLEARSRRLELLKSLGRFTDGIQIIILGTFGQFIYAGGAQQIKARHWTAAREFFGGYQGVGLSLIAIACVGLLGLFSLAITKTDRAYMVLMWAFSLSAAAWFIAVGLTHTLARTGSTGLWSLGLAGLFFLFSRVAITIATPIHPEEIRA